MDSFWEKHGLEKDQSMPRDQAMPILEGHLKTVNNILHIEESLINSVFNNMDNVGNQSIDRKEMFEFLTQQNFKIPREIASLRSNGTNSVFGIPKDNEPYQCFNAKPRDSAKYKETIERIKEVEQALNCFD